MRRSGKFPEKFSSDKIRGCSDAKLVCERNQVAGRSATGVPTLFEPQCQNIEWRYSEAAIAIRQDLDARITAADFATIAQAGAAHP
jgi:hypothetical protein